MRLLIFIFLCFPLLSFSQNHVPNNSFEEHENKLVFQWLQPQGQFYHFTEASKQNGPAASGDYFNGICLINHVASEYLEIKLKCPLVKGEKYNLSMSIRIDTSSMHNAEIVHSIDWLFVSQPKDVSTRVRIHVVPQISFPLDSILPLEWINLKADYVATGDEKFLIIGKFFQDADTLQKIQGSVNFDLAYIKKRIAMGEKAAIDSLKKTAMQPPKGHKEKHKAKSGPGMNYDEYQKMLKQKSVDTKNVHKEFKDLLAERIDSINKKYHVYDYYYDTRFFIDDVVIDGKDCDFSTVDTKILKPGKTFTVNNIFFETGRSGLLQESFPELDKLGKMLNENTAMKICIYGHTDNSGKPTANQKLSEERAKAVRDYLIQKGVDPKRLSFKGLGSSNPIADNATKEGREKNRRVEFMIVK